jgi:hypothetical protein
MKALAEVLRDRVLIPARNGVKTPGNLPAGASAAPGTAIRRQKKNKRTSEARS